MTPLTVQAALIKDAPGKKNMDHISTMIGTRT